jgi:hypothetical protein
MRLPCAAKEPLIFPYNVGFWLPLSLFCAARLER